MSTIYDKEQALFAEWIEHEKWIKDEDWTGMKDASLDDVFCPDGLHFTGGPYSYQIEGKSYCEVETGNEEELWNKAFLKPVFLCKDYYGIYPDEDGNIIYSNMDVRTEAGGCDDQLYYRFYARYMILLYGLTNYRRENNMFPTFSEASDINNYWYGEKGFFHAPVVRMNLKKIVGWQKCYDSVLSGYIKNDLAYITRQKDIYEGANVFICCHGGVPSNPIMELLKNEWFPDLKRYKDSSFLWYDETKKVVVLHEWHMSAPGVSYEEYYSAVYELQSFLEDNKGFFDKK